MVKLFAEVEYEEEQRKQGEKTQINTPVHARRAILYYKKPSHLVPVSDSYIASSLFIHISLFTKARGSKQ
jgi:hypothetical protein